MPTTASFDRKLFAFLSDLRKNNNRDWFQANKSRYERDVREPILQFVSDFGPRLRGISACFVADPRPSGGSMFRIHRDVRFSADKSPYKTNVGVQFRHKKGKDVHAPGFYLHLEPKRVFAAAGIWHPDGPSLVKVRQAIDSRPGDWRKALSGRKFEDAFALGGESLKRAPKGYVPDHPLIDDLKRKDFIVVSELSQKEATASGFLDRFADLCRTAAPLQKFLTRALDLEW